MGTVVVDDFEDGDITVSGANWSGWSGDTAPFGSSTQNSINGTYSGRLNAFDSNYTVTTTRSSASGLRLDALIRIEDDFRTTGDVVELRYEDTTTGGSLAVQFFGDGSIDTDFGISVSQSFSSDQVLSVSFRPDLDADTVELFIEGVSEGTASFGLDGLDRIAFQNDTRSSTGSIYAVLDDVEVTGLPLRPPTLTIDDTRSTEVDVAASFPTDADEVAVYASTDSGVTTSDTLVGTVTADGGTVTHSGLTNGEDYYYAGVASDTSGLRPDSGLSDEAVATTGFPSPTLSSVSVVSQTALDCTFQREDNNDDGALVVVVDGANEAVLNYDATSYSITGLTEATEYDISIRREVGPATSTSNTITQNTQPTAPDVSVDEIQGDDVILGIGDNSSGEDGYRALVSTDGDAFAVEGTAGANAATVTVSGLSRPATHTFKLEAFAGSGSTEATSQSGTVERYLAPARSSTNGATWLIEIEHSNGSVLRFRPTDAEFTPKLNALPRFSATVDYDERWLSSGFDDAPLRVWKNGRRLPIDTLTNRPTSPGETTLKGRGGSQLLRKADETVEQKTVHQTGEDLVTNRTDYVATFDDPDASTTTNTLLQTAESQSDFKQIVASLPDDVPLHYPGGSGLIRPAQTCFLFMNDGGDASPNGSYTTVTDPQLDQNNWEDADVMELNSQGESISVTFDVEHRIDSSNIGVAFRREWDANGGDIPIFAQLNGVEILDLDLGGSPSISWGQDWGSNYGTDLRPEDNPHTLSIAVDAPPTSGSHYRLDVAAVFDTRYHDHSAFPNQIETDSGSSGYLYLPGPQKYPDEVEVTTQDAVPPISASGARLVADVGGVYAAKQLELSGDQGSTWPLSATEAETLEGDFGSLVGQVRSRITLGVRGTGQNETPIDGYAAPELLSYDLYADLDDTPLYVAENFQNSVLDVLIDGADYADALFEVQWDEDAQSQAVEWTQPGQRTDVATTTLSDWNFDRSTEDRRDQIRVVGRSVTVRDEPVTADLDTEQQLAESPIVTDSEKVESSTTTFTQGQDYVIDWEAGTITTLSSGNISDGESLVVSYNWTPVGEATRAGATQPFTAIEVALPALSTDRECAVAARTIRDATDSPLEEAEITLPPDAIGVEAIDELQFTGLPTDDTLKVNDISDRAGSQVARVGTRESLQDFRDDLERKLSSTAKYS